MECHRMVAAAFVLLFLAPPTSADPPDRTGAKNQPISGLGVRQQHVERLMQQLEDKFLTLSQSLSQTEPERAARLQKALVESKQLSLERRMATIARLLDDSNLDQATDEQRKVLKDLEHLAELLVRDGERDEKLLELQRLEQWHDQIGRLVDAERSHLREADKLADKQKTLAELQKQIEAVEKLIARQQGLLQQAELARQHGIDDLGRIADEQHDLRDATQKLAEQVAGATPENRHNAAASSGGQPDGQPPARPGQQQIGQPGEKSGGQPDDKSEGEPSRQSGDQGSQKPGESNAGGKPGEKHGAQPGGQSGSGESGESQPGAAPLGDAARQQKDAEKNLADGHGKAGVQNQQVALTKLKEALEQLKQEKARIASLPPAALDKLAEKQGATADKTQKLGDDIAKAGEQSGPPGGEQGGQPGGMPADPQGGGPGGQPSQQPSPGQPGQRQIKEAQQQMREAEKQLEKHQPAGAVPPAADAVDKLKQALREIEDRLAQLREDERLEKLARLEARFRVILVRQQAATIATAAVDKKRQPDGSLRRSEIIMVSKLTDEERALAELVFQAWQIIRDDGTSVVFQRVVDHLDGDLKRVTGRLDQRQTGRATHAEQVEIEATLQELVAALEEAQKKPKKSSPGKSSGQSSPSDQDEPLLPGSAELKLLRAAQQRVNRMTSEFDKEWAGKPRDTVAGEEIRRIADRQQDINIMTDQMIQEK